jgi:lipopolysaccharide/colanic/teichoic acid biosynthesis glycosyltransferase
MPDRNPNSEPVDLSLPLCLDNDRVRISPVWAFAQRVLALTAGIFFLPVCILIGLAIKLTSTGPILFTQERPGHRGRLFRMVKFRTLEVGADVTNALGTAKGDPAITVIGGLLRNSKLDELPQLWNVVRGEMELVGPRPIPLALHEELAKNIPGFDRRYAVRPGLTNVSQVAVLDNKLGEQLIADWSVRFEGELHYIENKSFFYDLIVVAMTFGFVAKKVSRDRVPASAKS